MLTKITKKTAIYLLLLVSFSSCQEEVITPNAQNSGNNSGVISNNPSNTSSSFFAKVDGVEFQETLLYASATQMTGMITITASENASFPSIGLEFADNITPGTYPFAGLVGSPRGLYNLGINSNELFYAEGASGDLVITNHDMVNNIVEGTFSFTAVPNDVMQTTPTYSITEGAFSVSY